MPKIQDQLNALFDAERGLRRAEESLLQNEPKELSALLSAAVKEAKGLEDRARAACASSGSPTCARKCPAPR